MKSSVTYFIPPYKCLVCDEQVDRCGRAVAVSPFAILDKNNS